jgi:nucleotide-binding universal stress UspA family protein
MRSDSPVEEQMPIAENISELKLNRIVVATDFKSEAETATEFAGLLAKHFSSDLTIAHVLDLSLATRSESAVPGWPLDKMRHDSVENMEHTLSQLTGQGFQVHSRQIESHNPAASIVSLAETSDADLLVIGTSSRHGLNKLIVGSCAEGVIHHAKCPVVTLGPKAKRSFENGLNLKTVIFATDLHHEAKEKAAMALAFAKESLAKVYMCHILETLPADRFDVADLRCDSELALLRLVPTSTYDWCTMEYVIVSGDAGQRIVELAKQTGADLIVLGARRTTSYLTRMAKSVVEHVLANSECPVMTICTD